MTMARADRWRRLHVATTASIVSVAVAGVLTGCSVTTQDRPVPIADDTPAYSSGEPGTSSTSSTVSAPIFLVRGGQLYRVERRVPRGEGLDGVLGSLEEGPDDFELFSGLRSALPAGGPHLRWRVSDGVAVIALPKDFAGLGIVEQVLAIGQIVYTATAINGIDAVQVTSGDRPVEVPVGTGELVSRPVTRDDFRAIAPR
jgi:spore germination protein GerM